MQTTFNEQLTEAFAGAEADVGPSEVVSARQESATTLAFGLLVAQGSDDDGCTIFADEAVPLGVLLHSHATSAYADTGVIQGEVASVMRKGRVWVSVEDAVDVGAPAYARHTTSGGDATKGKFRGDNDGVAQVTTVTPTSANDTLFSLDVSARGVPYHFEVLSDGGSSATEICDAFRLAMAANAAFTARIVASGTATLILTSQDAGEAFYVSSGGSVGAYASIAATTPASSTADLVAGAFFRTSTEGAGLAVLEINLPQ
jgi:hypothetical protein